MWKTKQKSVQFLEVFIPLYFWKFYFNNELNVPFIETQVTPGQFNHNIVLHHGQWSWIFKINFQETVFLCQFGMTKVSTYYCTTQYEPWGSAAVVMGTTGLTAGIANQSCNTFIMFYCCSQDKTPDRRCWLHPHTSIAPNLWISRTSATHKTSFFLAQSIDVSYSSAS